MRRVIMASLMMVAAAACIVGDTSHRLYLESDGSVSWVVLARDLRSTESTAAARQREEDGWVDELHAGVHPLAEAFRCLGASELEQRLLREQRPFALWSEARFPSLKSLVEEILYQLGVDGVVSLTTAGGLTVLEVEIAPGQADAEVRDEAVLGLVDDLEDYRIVLAEGRFVEAVGFAIEDDGTAAVPLEPAPQPEGEALRPLCLRLVWCSECAAAVP